MAEPQQDYKSAKVSDSKFPIPLLENFQHIAIDAAGSRGKLTPAQKSSLLSNIQLMRDTIVFFTATASARGCGGHTGGPYDICPEVAVMLALFASDPTQEKYVHTFFDEAGHRVAVQYLLSALSGELPIEQLMHHREAHSRLPGHPELGLTPGVKFSSGRLGHMWPMVNGVALANRGKSVFCLGSDGSQMEGNDAEAARLAVAQGIDVKMLIDDNDVTIAGHPSEYLKGTSVAKTLAGHGLHVIHADGEDIDSLFAAIVESVLFEGPCAVISKREMMPGVEGLAGTTHAHDCIPVDKAIKYLKSRGYSESVTDILTSIKPSPNAYLYTGVSKDKEACRSAFGVAVCNVLDKLSVEEVRSKVCVIDSDLEGSTGIAAIHKKHPECFISSGIMERGNLAAASGFGFDPTKFGVFSTFSAFLEMTISEITMARLNFCNLLAHFSHSGIDEMADNTCHFGINQYFADNGLLDAHPTMLYFPADAAQMHAVVNKVFFETGLRFIFSTRSKSPYILKEGTQERLFEGDYQFTGKDEVIRTGDDATIVTYGDSLHRCLDAVERLRVEGIMVTLINKPLINQVDEEAIQIWGKSKAVLVVETVNQKTGMGSKAGTWLLERGLSPKYGYMGTNREGCGGLHEQVFHQGLDSQSIMVKLKSLL